MTKKPRNWKAVNELHAAAHLVIDPVGFDSRSARSRRDPFLFRRNTEAAKEIGRRLVYERGMERAWELLNDSRKGYWSDTALADSFANEFIDCCISAVDDYQRVPSLTLTANRNRYTKLARIAEELAEGINADIRLETAAGDVQFQERMLDSLEHLLRSIGSHYQGLEQLSSISDDLMKAMVERIVDVARACLPTTSAQLQTVAGAAKNIAKSGPISTRPNLANAAFTYFTTRLSHDLIPLSGKKAAYEVAAITAAMIFRMPKDVDPASILRVVEKRGSKSKGKRNLSGTKSKKGA